MVNYTTMMCPYTHLPRRITNTIIPVLVKAALRGEIFCRKGHLDPNSIRPGVDSTRGHLDPRFTRDEKMQHGPVTRGPKAPEFAHGLTHKWGLHGSCRRSPGSKFEVGELDQVKLTSGQVNPGSSQPGVKLTPCRIATSASWQRRSLSAGVTA